MRPSIFNESDEGSIVDNPLRQSQLDTDGTNHKRAGKRKNRGAETYVQRKIQSEQVLKVIDSWKELYEQRVTKSIERCKVLSHSGQSSTELVIVIKDSSNTIKCVNISRDYPILTEKVWVAKPDSAIDIIRLRKNNLSESRKNELLEELNRHIELPKGWTIIGEWYSELNRTKDFQNNRKEGGGKAAEVDTKGIKLSFLLKAFMSSMRQHDSSTMDEYLTKWNKELIEKGKLLEQENLKVEQQPNILTQPAHEEMLFLKFLSLVNEKKGLSKEKDHPVVGDGQVYIVCDFQSDFRDVLISLQEFFRTTPDIFVCMDGITHRPPAVVDGGQGQGQGAEEFESRIKKIGRLVLVTSNWKTMDESVLKQDSLLYEVYCATIKDKERKCKFDLALSLDDCSLIKEKTGAKEDIEQRLKRAIQTTTKDWRTEACNKISDRMMDLLSVPKGIKLSYLLSVFTDEKNFPNVSIKDGKESTRITRQLNNLTVTEFLDNCLKTIMTRTTDDIFYADYLQKFPPNNEKLVDYAEVYITCELANNFMTTMNTLRDHFNNKPDTYIAIERITHRTPTKQETFIIDKTTATHKCKRCLKKTTGYDDASAPLVSPVSSCSSPGGTRHDWDAINPASITAATSTHQCKKCLKKTSEDDTISPPLVAPDSRCLATGGDGAHEWVPASQTTVFLIDQFEDRIKRIHHVVVVMSPWNNMGFLQRTALLFEIYCAYKNNCSFDIALSWYDKKRLIDFFRKSGRAAIETALEGIDIGKSKCGFQSMRNAIVNSVPSDTNGKIKQFLIDHLTKLSGVSKGIKLSHLTKVFHSLSGVIDPNLETRNIGEFTDALKEKLKTVYNEQRIVVSNNSSSQLPEQSEPNSKASSSENEAHQYISYLEEHCPSVVGPGQVYVSYDPEGLFYNTLETLKQHFESNPDVFVCLDNITHRRPTMGDGTGAVFLIDQFEATIKQIGHVVLVMSPWNNLRIFRRTAMLFEIHCAVTNDCKFEIALSDYDRKELSKAVVNGVVDEMMEGLEWINFEKSVSRFHSLNELVKVAVKPFDIANLVVSNAVRDCLIAQSQSKGGLDNKLPFMLSIAKEQKKSKPTANKKRSPANGDEINDQSTGLVPRVASGRTILEKEDIMHFMVELNLELSGNSLVANMRQLVLYGRISLGGFSIARDCTKNYLHLTIESPPLQRDPSQVMTLQISVDNKESSNKVRVLPQPAPLDNTIVSTNKKSSLLAFALSVKTWIHDTAYLLWYGDSVTEYRDTDLHDKQVVQKIVHDFVNILDLTSSVEEVDSQDKNTVDTKDIEKCLEIVDNIDKHIQSFESGSDKLQDTGGGAIKDSFGLKEISDEVLFDTFYEQLRGFIFFKDKDVLKGDILFSQVFNHIEASEAVNVSLTNITRDCGKNNPADANFCIIGTGTIAKLLQDNLFKQLKSPKLTIVNRWGDIHSDEHAHVESKHMDQMWDIIKTSDVVFTIFAPENIFITESKLRESLLGRTGNLQIVDLADPGNVDPICSTIDGVVYYNMKDLREEFSFTRKGEKVPLFNGKVFCKVVPDLNRPQDSIFSRCSKVVAQKFGERSPRALMFRDLDVISSFVCTQLEREKYMWKWNEYFHDQSNEAFEDDEAANDALYQLMMVWESKIEKIEEFDDKTLTIYFENPLPQSYYRYMYRSNGDKKLLLLCLNDTEYGGAWEITWIGVSRKMVKCVCPHTAEDTDSKKGGNTQTLRAEWELKERLKCEDSKVSKSVYLEKKRILNMEERARNAGHAFFAPIPVIYCSCMNYSLLDVDLTEKSFQADAWYHFRLEEIGKDAACEEYVLDYLGRYGFDVDKSIDFPDEITSRTANSQVDKFFHYERKGNSFMYDYTIQIRKQSDFAAGLKMRYFPFDQQRLALEVSLSTAKENIELEYDENGGELYNIVDKKKTDFEESKRKKRKKLESEFLYDDSVLAEQYKIIYADEGQWKPWALPDKRKEKPHWKIVFFVLVRRRYSFYIYSSLCPLVVFCLLSFLTFGVNNDCSELDVSTKITITLTLLLSAVAFKVSISAFLPQNPYFTMLDTFMWALTYFIGLVALENLAWPAAVCTNLGANLDQSDESGVLYVLIVLLAGMVVAMFITVLWIREQNQRELLKLRRDGVVSKVKDE